ncbi:MAG: hypothetical protein A3K19_22150 [Lentisphaerae bacterium RIFOXYB12_FULL_65_16]|nr:MAG: hypothetical protein A3K18_21420 [Lentisphaerae bacterium RIFOXYA12_64_32]OGV93564.1 MAG: hypothetical protein A3K19_22150 [Lentisphaerae bacterium RIFOXYB12_FULL_65_16]
MPDVDERVRGLAADTRPALEQNHLGAVPCRADRGCNTGWSAAADQNVGLGEDRDCVLWDNDAGGACLTIC